MSPHSPQLGEDSARKMFVFSIELKYMEGPGPWWYDVVIPGPAGFPGSVDVKTWDNTQAVGVLNLHAVDDLQWKYSKDERIDWISWSHRDIHHLCGQ